MFQFITQENLVSCIKQEFYNNLVAGLSQSDLDRIEAAALKMVFDKLRHRFDVDAIKTAGEKDASIVQWVINIMLYNLHRRNNPRGIPENIATDYDSTITWLNDIRDLKEHPDLPLLIGEDGEEDLGSNDLRFGSNPTIERGDFYGS